MPFVDRNNPDPSQPLPKPKWEKFCLEYVKDNNAGEAAKRAGYKESAAQHIGSKLSLSKFIGSRLKYLQSKKIEDVNISVEYILNGIKAIADNPSAFNKDKLRAFELLGKNKSLFIDRIKHEGLPKRIIIRNETGKEEEVIGN